MPVPSTRTPVRVARGTYANLSTVDALASLQEGEICFATDQQRLYVKQGGSLTPISAASAAAPTPSDVSASPTFAGGTGTQADPYQLTSVGVPTSGSSITASQTVTVNGTAGDFLIVTDNSPIASGTRFAEQSVGNLNAAGNFSFNLTYEDNPGTTVDNTTYTGLFQIGTTHFLWTVVQSNLTPLTVSTPSTIAGDAEVGATLTATTGTVAGGSGNYTFSYQWQRSFDGVNIFYDINGETSASYTAGYGDAGLYLRCLVTASDDTDAAQGGPLTVELPSASSAAIFGTSGPDITSATLTDTGASTDRFTNEVFSVSSTMGREGAPVANKGYKVKFEGSFTAPPSTSSVASIDDLSDITGQINQTGPVRNLTEITGSAYTEAENMYSTSAVHGQYYSQPLFVQKETADGNGGEIKSLIYYYQSFQQWYPYTYLYQILNRKPTTLNPNHGTLMSKGIIYRVNCSGSRTVYYTDNAGTSENSYPWYDGSFHPLFDADGEYAGSACFDYRHGKGLQIDRWDESTYTYQLDSYNNNTTNDSNGQSANNGFNLDNNGGQTYIPHIGFKGGRLGIIYCASRNPTSTSHFGDINHTGQDVFRIWEDVLERSSSATYGSYGRMTNRNNYTDITLDQIWPIESSPAPNGSTDNIEYYNFVGHSAPADAGPDMVLLFYRYTTKECVVLRCNHDDDPTVASNWSSHYTQFGDEMNSTPRPERTYIDSHGTIWLNTGYSYNAFSHDYGQTWSYLNQQQNSPVTTRQDLTLQASYHTWTHWDRFSGRWFACIEAQTPIAHDGVSRSGHSIRTSLDGQQWIDLCFQEYNDSYSNNLGNTQRWDRIADTGARSYGCKNYHLLRRMARTEGLLFLRQQVTQNKYIAYVYLRDYNQYNMTDGTNLNNNEFLMGDTIRQGLVTAKIREINSSNNSIKLMQESGTIVTGQPFQNTVSHLGTQNATLYGLINNTNSIYDFTTSDPGFTQLGTSNTLNIAFPGTMPTGNTPDSELPSGTTMTVEVEASNASGSDTVATNTIVPS